MSDATFTEAVLWLPGDLECCLPHDKVVDSVVRADSLAQDGQDPVLLVGVLRRLEMERKERERERVKSETE